MDTGEAPVGATTPFKLAVVSQVEKKRRLSYGYSNSWRQSRSGVGVVTQTWSTGLEQASIRVQDLLRDRPLCCMADNESKELEEQLALSNQRINSSRPWSMC
jgi:hypothetical protein